MVLNPKDFELGKVYDYKGERILVLDLDGAGGFMSIDVSKLRKPASDFNGPVGKTIIEWNKEDPRLKKYTRNIPTIFI